MATIQIELSETTAKAALDAGLLTPQALERLLKEALKRQADTEALRLEIQKGIDSGPGIPADEVFDRLEAKYRALAQNRRA
ncbi:MAG: ribbon-helix-helix domain-containing protein [Pseudomonadota bacterium]